MVTFTASGARNIQLAIIFVSIFSIGIYLYTGTSSIAATTRETVNTGLSNVGITTPANPSTPSYDDDYSATSPFDPFKKIFHDTKLTPKDAFIESFLSNDIDGKFDNSSLTTLCEGEKIDGKGKTEYRKWIEGLIFSCEHDMSEGKGTKEENEGGGVMGVMSARNVVLNCVRYGIEAGAKSFILPTIQHLKPSFSNEKETVVELPFGHLFDAQHFVSSLTTACPNISFYNSRDELYDLPSTSKALVLEPSTLENLTIHNLFLGEILSAPGEWNQQFTDWLSNKTYPHPPSKEMPKLVSLQQPFLEFPLAYDPKPFVSNFGRILRSSLQIRKMAAEVLWAMDGKYNGSLGVADAVNFGKDDRVGEVKKLFGGADFLGVHYRTGRDAEDAGWPDAETQIANYIEQAYKTNSHTIYVAGLPDSADLKSFIDAAAAVPKGRDITVVTKETALQSSSDKDKDSERVIEEYSRLSWDQKQLVDYEVLLWGKQFAGITESTFSWGVAMRRHIVSSGGNWVNVEIREKWKESDGDGGLWGRDTSRRRRLTRERMGVAGGDEEVEVEADTYGTSVDTTGDRARGGSTGRKIEKEELTNDRFQTSPSRFKSPFFLDLMWQNPFKYLDRGGKRVEPLDSVHRTPVSAAASARSKQHPKGRKAKRGATEHHDKGDEEPAKEGEVVFLDKLSTIFGRRGNEGARRIGASLWP